MNDENVITEEQRAAYEALKAAKDSVDMDELVRAVAAKEPGATEASKEYFDRVDAASRAFERAMGWTAEQLPHRKS